MTALSSTIQILKVDVPVEKTGKDGNKYTIHTAQTALLNDAGELEVVGRMRIPEAMREKVKVGIFRAGFALEVVGWGLNKGDVAAALVDLVPLPPSAMSRPPLSVGTASAAAPLNTRPTA